MPDPILMTQATGLAFVAAAVMLGIYVGRGRRRAIDPVWVDVGWVVGLGVGFYAGWWVLGIRPHWPLAEDLDRLLAIVVPAVLAVELVSAFPRVPRWLSWVLRLAVAGGVARVLLHGSTYLASPAEAGALTWPPALAWLVLGLLAAAQAVVWGLLDLLARRSPGVTLTIGLGIAIGGSAIAIMLSGYATGGQAGLPLSAAVLGASAAAMVPGSPARSRLTAPIGVAVVGLSSLLIIGRFFGELRTDHAVLLFLSPLLAWVPEIPGLRRMPAWARGLTRVLLVALLVSAVLGDAVRRFVERSAPSAPGSDDSSAEDFYKDYAP
jgi:hypothetical protein